MNLRYTFLFVSLFFLTSCDFFDPQEKIPAYIHIESFNFTTSSEQGSSSSNITDAWVYVDDQLIGAFELPVTFPVLFEGTHTIKVKPGIKLNGISESRVINPFYTAYTTTINLIPDSVINLTPNSTYYPSVIFKWKEAFEDGGISLEKTTRSDTTLEKTSDITKVFEGDYSGKINVDDTRDFFECKTSASYDLPQTGSSVFLELNYKNDIPFSVGVFANATGTSIQHELLVLNPTNTWKKIYINLTGRVSEESDADSFQIFFGCQKPANVANGEILLDNIKLIHY
jgi:hypothetical protein